MVIFLRRPYVGPVGTPLGNYTEGEIVKINEGGNPVDFYVAKHDYESGLNGAGRTLLVRKDCYDKRARNETNQYKYSGCDLDDWFNTGYKSLLDVKIQSEIGATKFYCGTNTLERAVFALSITELGLEDSAYESVPTEGQILPIAYTLKISHFNGIASSQWTRSSETEYGEYCCFVDKEGNYVSNPATSIEGSRPAFTLPSTILVSSDGLIS